MANTQLFYCTHCHARAHLAVIGEDNYREDEYGTNIYRFYGHCVKCYKPGIITREEIGHDTLDDPKQIFPIMFNEVKFSYPLPDQVKESYIEARKCAAIGAWSATAVMIRRTLEAVVRDFDGKTKTLHAGLQKMKEKGAISEEFLAWGDELRFIGNSGAHATEQKVSEQDVTDALDFAGAIIETIFHLRPKFAAMRTRRHTKADPAGKPSQGDMESSDD